MEGGNRCVDRVNIDPQLTLHQDKATQCEILIHSSQDSGLPTYENATADLQSVPLLITPVAPTPAPTPAPIPPSRPGRISCSRPGRIYASPNGPPVEKVIKDIILSVSMAILFVLAVLMFLPEEMFLVCGPISIFSIILMGYKNILDVKYKDAVAKLHTGCVCNIV